MGTWNLVVAGGLLCAFVLLFFPPSHPGVEHRLVLEAEPACAGDACLLKCVSLVLWGGGALPPLQLQSVWILSR